MEIVRFGQLYAIPSGNGLSRPSDVRGEGYRMIGMGELFEKDIITDMEMDRVQMSEREKKTFLVEADDLLFARQSLVAAGAGKCSIVKKLSEPTTYESHLIRVRLDKQECNPWYYYYLFKLPDNPIKAIVNQCAQAGIRGNELIKIKVPLPERRTQDRVASILSAYDNLIEVNNKRIKTLEQMAENLYKEWFVRFRFPGHEEAEFENGLPKGWRISTLGKEARFINGRAYLMPELQETGKYRIVRVGNFSGKDEWFFSDMELEKDKYCERGDLLYKWSCNFGPEIWNEEIAIYHYHIWKVLPGENMTKGFLFHYLSNSTKLWLSGTNGTAMAHITKASIEKKKIIVPSLEILKDFESYAQLIMDQGLSIKKQNENLIKQRDLLLPRLMSGKLEV